MNNPIKVSFRVASVSSNHNSFGLYGHILIARNGQAFEAVRSRGPWNEDLKKGNDVTLDAIETPEGKVLITWASQGFECPRQLPNAPMKVIREVYNDGRPM